MLVKVFSRPASVYQANQRLHGAPFTVSRSDNTELSTLPSREIGDF